jgi:NADPH-dependent 2,4-dienoyl-CoA reductase/sulfur reductase-like enzyme/ferredoxin
MTRVLLPLITPRTEFDGRSFPPYTQLPRTVPRDAWHYVRAASVAGYVALVVTLFVDPADGLFAFWNVIVPLLPMLFFVAPGVWRNLCPLAAANQAPRVFGFTRALKLPRPLAERGHLVAITAFLVAVGSRKLLLNTNGAATAGVLAFTISVAFLGGLAYRGKSGWCSSMCPLLPVQRLYGQTPFVVSPNSHCEPCVGCTKNCYDFNPTVAYQADMADADPDWGASRRLFAGIFPGLVLAYFLLSGPPAQSRGTFLLQLAGAAAVSVGGYFAAQAITGLRWSTLSAVWGAVAFSSFYWFAGVLLAADLTRWTGTDLSVLRWPIRALAWALAVVWLVRTFGVRRRYAAVAAAAPTTRIDESRLRELQASSESGSAPTVTVEPDGRSILTAAGNTLLDVVESADLSIEAGCRMGLCGADPIAVRAGAENLAPPTDDERATLRRLCIPDGNRLACQAVVLGDCTISLTPDRSGAPATAAPVSAPTTGRAPLGRIVVLGGGIAGVTVAEKLREEDAECAIALVNQEAHHLYNRMGISRLIYGRSAMAGLYLLPDSWFEAQRIDSWLNTVARSVDVPNHTVRLATGELLDWDVLVFATGSRASVPPVTGYGRPGTFAVREAGDAAQIRAYAQRIGARAAVIGGGGVLGLEAAYSLHRLGLRVTVLERAARLLTRGADARAAALLFEYLTRTGIDVLTGVTATAVEGDGGVERVLLDDDTALEAQLFVGAVGVTPNAELARDAGILVNRGIVVDERLRTSVPGVYACGDVAEVAGRAWGLWPVAVRQAQVAAATILGGDERFAVAEPPMILKGVGVALTSIGSFESGADQEPIVYDDGDGQYARLVVSGNRLVGGLLYGFNREVPHLHRLVESGTDIAAVLRKLRAGEISALAQTGTVRPVAESVPG